MLILAIKIAREIFRTYNLEPNVPIVSRIIIKYNVSLD